MTRIATAVAANARSDSLFLALAAADRALLVHLWHEAATCDLGGQDLANWIGARFRSATARGVRPGLIWAAQPSDLPMPGDPTPEEIERHKEEIRSRCGIRCRRRVCGEREPRVVRYHGHDALALERAADRIE